MTFKDLQRLIGSQSDVNRSTISPQEKSTTSKTKRQTALIWDSSLHKDKGRIRGGNCCFNHIIGLPRKDGVLKPFFDYEKMLYMALPEPGYPNGPPSLQIQMILQA